VRWFQAFASKQNPPLSKILSTWSDEWAVFAYQQYRASLQPSPGTHYSPGELETKRRSRRQD
jgi:hypothetical protein